MDVERVYTCRQLKSGGVKRREVWVNNGYRDQIPDRAIAGFRNQASTGRG